MANILCPLWGTHAVGQEVMGDSKRVNSVRAGGPYQIAVTAISILESLSVEDKAKLTSWLVDQRRAGVAEPLINSESIRAAKSRRPLRHGERKRRFFELLTHLNWGVSDHLKIGGTVDEKYFDDRSRIAAWTELNLETEVGPFVGLLRDEGLLQTGNGYIYSLTPKGFEELERVQVSNNSTPLAFIAMWFDPSMDQVYAEGLEPAVRRAGYEPIRIDKKEHNNKIDDEIIADIKRSRFIVADFTCSTILAADGSSHAVPRGGVYFEAGFAYGLGLPVIWVCREDHMGLVHFDTNHFAHILWNTPAELEKRLYDRIVHVVGLGPE